MRWRINEDCATRGDWGTNILEGGFGCGGGVCGGGGGGGGGGGSGGGGGGGGVEIWDQMNFGTNEMRTYGMGEVYEC